MERSLRALFSAQFGEEPSRVTPLKSHGSARKLFRLFGSRGSVIGALNADLKENAAFIGFSRHFRKEGLPVPEIYAHDAENGAYLEEDLGDTTLFELLTSTRGPQGPSPQALDVYRQSLRCLPKFQILAGKTLDYGLCYPRASFDRQSMLWDLNYFKYYFLRLAKIPLDEQSLEDDYGRFTDFLLAAPRIFFLYRDFQSRNIMVRDGKPWFIDYQGGRKGALPYDIASLLFDAKADLPFPLREELLELYLDEASRLTPIDRKEFRRYYAGYAFIRIMQAMGTYGLRGFYEHKSQFLLSIPYAIRNLEHLLRTSDLPVDIPELTRVWRRLVSSSVLRQFGGISLRLTVRVQSFPYQEGMPVDEKGHGGGFVFDCRCLPNPGKHERFAALTGKDPEIVAYLDHKEAVSRFLEHAWSLIEQAVDDYRGRNFTDLTVAFGCTGGRHRSVYCAEKIAARLRQKGVDVELSHRRDESEEESA